MREDIKESVERMSKEDRKDVAMTMGIWSARKDVILRVALKDEDVAEYVLQY